MSRQPTKGMAPAPCDPMPAPGATAGCWLSKVFNFGASVISGFFRSRPVSSLDGSNKSNGSCDHVSSDVAKEEPAEMATAYNGERSERPWRNSRTTSGFRSLLMEGNLRPYQIPFPSYMEVNRASHGRASCEPATSPLEIAKTYMETAPRSLRIPPTRVALQAPWMRGNLQARGTQLPSYTGLRPSMASQAKLGFRSELNRADKTQFPMNRCNTYPVRQSAEQLTSPRKKEWPENICSAFTPSASLSPSERMRVDNGADHIQHEQPTTSFQLCDEKSLEQEPAPEVNDRSFQVGGLSLRAKGSKRKQREDENSIVSTSKAAKKTKYEGPPLRIIEREDNHNAHTIAQLERKREELNLSKWEEKVFVSKDGRAKLKTQAFFASFDQCSDKFRGNRACSALAAVVSHWLHSNQGRMPTRPELDNLIVKGSLEWQNLCNHLGLFLPSDQYLDINTVMNAGIGPISASIANSFVGVFNPEKFWYLRNLDSFDDVWCKAVSSVEGGERVYIFEWNEHFFVLKVDSQACYIIDTLGERLYEGCNRAYILKFDSSSMMEMVGSEMGTVLVCEGRDCCKEFIKSFYAAHIVREMEMDPNKDVATLFSRLQFDLTYIEA